MKKMKWVNHPIRILIDGKIVLDKKAKILVEVDENNEKVKTNTKE